MCYWPQKNRFQFEITYLAKGKSDDSNEIWLNFLTQSSSDSNGQILGLNF